MVWLLVAVLVLVMVLAGAVVGFYMYASREMEEVFHKVDAARLEVHDSLEQEYALFDGLTDVAEGYMKHQREELDRLRAISPDVGSAVPELADARDRLLELKIDFLESVDDYPELIDDEEFQTVLGRLEEAREDTRERVRRYNRTAGAYNDLVETVPYSYVAEREEFRAVPMFESV